MANHQRTDTNGSEWAEIEDKEKIERDAKRQETLKYLQA